MPGTVLGAQDSIVNKIQSRLGVTLSRSITSCLALWVRRLSICVVCYCWTKLLLPSLYWTRRYPNWWWKPATIWKVLHNASACTLDQNLVPLQPFNDLTDLAIWPWASIRTRGQTMLSHALVHFAPSNTRPEGGGLWCAERLCDLPSSLSWWETSWH